MEQPSHVVSDDLLRPGPPQSDAGLRGGDVGAPAAPPYRRMSYDNRHAPRSLYMRLRGLDGPMHFKLTFGGKRLVYCYIRKNGCTAFKNLFLGLSGAEARPEPGANPLLFLSQLHLARFPRDIQEADHTIFVYRDPVERAVSVYKNKFIARSGPDDIFASFVSQSGLNPARATFRQFVFDYLRPNLDRLDPHVMPQHRHLLPIPYSDAIPLSRLRDGMAAIVGDEIADRYFAEKTNASDGRTTNGTVERTHERTKADRLHALYRDFGIMPPTDAFLKPDIVARLRRIYREDVEMLDRIHARRRQQTPP